MTDVPDYLVPSDGLSNAFIRYAGFEAADERGGNAIHRFDLFDENQAYAGTFDIETEPDDSNSIDSMVTDAHRQMVNILRQLLFVAGTAYQSREKLAAQ